MMCAGVQAAMHRTLHAHPPQHAAPLTALRAPQPPLLRAASQRQLQLQLWAQHPPRKMRFRSTRRPQLPGLASAERKVPAAAAWALRTEGEQYPRGRMMA